MAYFHLNRISKSISYAIDGLKVAYHTQWNFRIHCFGFVFMNFSAWYFQFERVDYVLCLICSALVFSAELLNTAIEKTVDICSPEYSPLAKIAKDCAAGAVLILAICALVVWIITLSESRGLSESVIFLQNKINTI